MATAFATTAVATAAGVDGGGYTAAGVDTATAAATGYAALGIPAPPPAGTAPDALRLELVTKAGVQLIPDLARRNLSFSVEHNGSGSISFEADLDTFALGLDDPALGVDVLVRVHYGDLAAWPYGVAEGVLMAAPPTKDDTGRWIVRLDCPGSWDVLDLGLLWPSVNASTPLGVAGETREFSYTAGDTGPSWVPAEWARPYGYNVRRSFRWRNRWPKGWPESSAQWIWSTSPEKPSALGTRNFVSDPITLTGTHSYRIYVAGDENLRLYLNGSLIKLKRFGAWKTTTSFTRTLKAGTYTFAATVANVAGGDSKSGFLFAMAKLNSDGSRNSWMLRSNTTRWKFRKVAGYFAQVPLPPDGWYPAAVLAQQVTEAAARGVEFHPQIVKTFTTTADSNGSAWTAKGPAEYEIGITGAELGEKIRAASVDLAMLPGLRLSAWKQRGFDLRDRVVISTPLGIGWPSKAWPRVRTVGLTHHESGYTETPGSASVAATYGRRELMISGGGVDGDVQADIFAGQAMTTAASPESTIEATISTSQISDPDKPAPQPFRDFNVADIVTFETVGGFIPVKIMAISAAEQDTREVRFTISGYPVEGD